MINKGLDKLVQKVSCNQYCRVCAKHGIKKVAECGHHIIRRDDNLLRYDIINIMPVCYEHHRAIHDGKIKEVDIVNPDIWSYLQRVKNMSYKDFLIFELGLTEKEYFKQCRKKLKSLLN